MTFFMEYLRKKLGWCPNAAVTGTVRRRYAAPAGEVGMAREGNRDVVEGALVDYGPIGTPATLFILPVAAALLIGCLAVTPPAGEPASAGYHAGLLQYRVVRGHEKGPH
jgi:hypothetical protein